MKKSILFSIVIGALALLISCSNPVPEEVESAFKATFPEATDIEWEMEDDQVWEVEFEMDEEEYTACFSAAGEWMETEKEIDIESIPDDILESLFIEYAGFLIKEAEWVKKPDFEGYEIEVDMDLEEGGTKPMEITVANNGDIVLAEEEEEEED